ncbi:MAG: aminodeoxychorismate/anthranilate synthase component II [Phycisphaeraceae bacterium]|nr:aminodeoxychorismate/anthranilate synthase component II [Phycisphaeraceae bacterium]
MILLIDNYDSFTWNLVQRLGELDPTLEPGRDLVVVRNDRIQPGEAEALDAGRGPSHVIISPGPGTPKEAGVSAAMIAHFAGRVPVLGVCLGHQCLGDMHGMAVSRHAIQVHGKTSPVHHDGAGVFSGLPVPFDATRYHSLVVPVDAVPETPVGGADSWAISAWTTDRLDDGREVRVVMGLRRVWADAGKAPLEGVQFHPESFLTSHGPGLLANFLRMGARPREARVDPMLHAIN